MHPRIYHPTFGFLLPRSSTSSSSSSSAAAVSVAATNNAATPSVSPPTVTTVPPMGVITPSSLSSTTTSSSSSYNKYGGYIVARTLPSNIPPDYDQHTKPSHHRRRISLQKPSSSSSSPIIIPSSSTTPMILLSDDSDPRTKNGVNEETSNEKNNDDDNKKLDIQSLLLLSSSKIGDGDIDDNKHLQEEEEEDDDSSMMRIDAYLFPLPLIKEIRQQKEEEQEQDVATTTTTNSNTESDITMVVDDDSILSMTFIRKQCEPILSALKRIEITAMKRLFPKSKSKTKNKSKNKKMAKKGLETNTGSNNSTSGNSSSRIRIYVDGQSVEDWQDQLVGITNREFWQLASSSSDDDNNNAAVAEQSNGSSASSYSSPHRLELGLVIVDEEQDDDDNDHKSKNSVDKTTTTTLNTSNTIRLPVECNPPTICGVSTYEKFDSQLFPGIPIVVEIQSLYATHVVIDWYRNEQLVKHDSCCYIPTVEDAQKQLSIVVTPQRKKKKKKKKATSTRTDNEQTDPKYNEKRENNDDDNDVLEHDGRGYQEAYQFSQSVQDSMDENLLLSIRHPNDWIVPVLGQLHDRRPSATASDTTRTTTNNDGNDDDDNDTTSDSILRILSYNILADQNAFSMEEPGKPFFPWTTPELIDRKRRMPLIVHEILSYGADILCLQEVDELVYDTIFRPVLSHYNYEGFFSMKQATGTREGCAMFFTREKFQSQRQQQQQQHCPQGPQASENNDINENKVFEEALRTIRISDILNDIVHPINNEDNSNESSTFRSPHGWEDSVKPIRKLFEECPELQETVNNLGHVCQFARLLDTDGNPIIVANTHLFFHPLADHIRVLQCFAIAYQLAIEMNELSLDGKEPAFVLAGDFNTGLDDCAKILVDHRIPENYRDVQRCLNTFRWKEQHHCKLSNDSSSAKQINFPALQLPDHFPKMISGYTDVEFTHYVKEYKATLDHILLSSGTSTSGKLKPIRQASLPTLDQVTRHTAMPSIHFPSDHCSIVVDATWTKPN